MIPVPGRDARPLQRVLLIKHDGADGLPVGAEYQWTYTTCDPVRALQRARAALRRDFPGERPEHWRAA